MDTEIEKKHESLEEFQVIINDHQVFHPGEKLTGVVQLCGTKVLYVRRLFVKICGQAYVKWTESHHLESKEIVNCENYLNNSLVLLECTENNDDFESLLPGNNQFPFGFVIPSSHLPSSFHHGWHKKDYAAIRYWISAGVVLNNNEEYTVTQQFYLKETADLTGLSHFQGPKTVSAEKYIDWCCFKTGPITMSMEVTRSVYHPGDDILITASLINNTLSSFNTGKVEVQLVQAIKYIGNSDYTPNITSATTNDFEREELSTEKNILLSPRISSRRTTNWNNIRLKIPKVVVPTISCSKCIQLSYFVQLRVSFRVPEDCIVRIPIIIICKPRVNDFQDAESVIDRSEA